MDSRQPLGKFLPQLHSIAEGEGSGLRDASGALMPPCIIMEKGEALEVWIESSEGENDPYFGLQVRSADVREPRSCCTICSYHHQSATSTCPVLVI